MSTLFYVSYGALWLLLVIQTVLLLVVYRHFGIAALGSLEGVQRDGLPIGEAAPTITGVTSDGRYTRWEPDRARPELLLFAAPDCEPCAKVLPSVSRLGTATNGHQVAATVVVSGPQASAALLTEKFDLPFRCLAEDGNGAFERYRVRVTPFAFVIGGDGRILAKGLCNHPGRLRDLLVAGGLGEAAGAVLDPMIQLARREDSTRVGAKELAR